MKKFLTSLIVMAFLCAFSFASAAEASAKVPIEKSSVHFTKTETVSISTIKIQNVANYSPPVEKSNRFTETANYRTPKKYNFRRTNEIFYPPERLN